MTTAPIQHAILAVRDLDVHFLEAGDSQSPLILLLHGFPELSYSWRKVMVPLAQKGYHVVAPDQRGYGKTKSRSSGDKLITYDEDFSPYRLINLVHDVVALALAVGHRSVAAVVGHDFGSAVAGSCALVRPDFFKSVVLMSAPFSGPPSLPFNVRVQSVNPPQGDSAAPQLSLLDDFLASVDPPRKHYTAYYASRGANEDIHHPPQGLHAFLRAYFHMKSADWKRNDPHALANFTEMPIMPHYYIMPLHETMAQVVLREAPSPEEASNNKWLSDSELAEFVQQFERTGFQGGLNSYRVLRDPQCIEELSVFAEKKITIPSMYISGKKDWGVYQSPGAVQKMRGEVCTKMGEEDFVLIDDAGHWVQQEQSGRVVEHLSRFLHKVSPFPSSFRYRAQLIEVRTRHC